ncbi:MAG: superoxide dismutase family protein [Alphaproteobacteria bacterium]
MGKIATIIAGAAAAAAMLGTAHAASATADIVGAGGKSLGKATFTDAPTGVLIRLELQGLPAGYKGVHLHAVGTCEDHDHGFVASKAHINPDNRKHGLLNPEGPDSGDLPNVYVHSDGKAMAELFTTAVSISQRGGKATLLDADGAAILVHANPDDHTTQPIGGAGARVGCGVIKAAP